MLDGEEREAEGRGVDGVLKAVSELLFSDNVDRWDADRGRVAEAAAPQLAAGGEVDEGFGGGAVSLPIEIVLIVGGRRAYARRIVGKRRVPIGDRGFIRHAFDFRREVAIGGSAGELGDVFEAKCVVRFNDLAMRTVGLEVSELDRVAGFDGGALGGQIVGGPGVEDDFVVGERGDGLAGAVKDWIERPTVNLFPRPRIRKIDGGDGGIGNFPRPSAATM